MTIARYEQQRNFMVTQPEGDYVLHSDHVASMRAMEDQLNLPHDDDPFATIKFVNSGTFSPEEKKARAGGSIGDWMRRANVAETEMAEKDAEIARLSRSLSINEKALLDHCNERIAEAWKSQAEYELYGSSCGLPVDPSEATK